MRFFLPVNGNAWWCRKTAMKRLPVLNSAGYWRRCGRARCCCLVSQDNWFGESKSALPGTAPCRGSARRGKPRADDSPYTTAPRKVPTPMAEISGSTQPLAQSCCAHALFLQSPEAAFTVVIRLCCNHALHGRCRLARGGRSGAGLWIRPY